VVAARAATSFSGRILGIMQDFQLDLLSGLSGARTGSGVVWGLFGEDLHSFSGIFP